MHICIKENTYVHLLFYISVLDIYSFPYCYNVTTDKELIAYS